MPVSFAKRCTKFTSQESSAAMPTSQRMPSPLEEHYLRYWRISLNRGAGVYYWRRMPSNKASLRRSGLSFIAGRTLSDDASEQLNRARIRQLLRTSRGGLLQFLAPSSGHWNDAFFRSSIMLYVVCYVMLK